MIFKALFLGDLSEWILLRLAQLSNSYQLFGSNHNNHSFPLI